MTKQKKEQFEIPFHSPEQLTLHQLRLLEWMATTGRKRFVDEDASAEETATEPAALPDKWQLTKGIQPYEWQEKCIGNWFQKKGRGTVKVVTGAGKTLLALAIAERIQNTEDNGLRLAIVVPTIVLMHQWYDAICEHGKASGMCDELVWDLSDVLDCFSGDESLKEIFWSILFRAIANNQNLIRWPVYRLDDLLPANRNGKATQLTPGERYVKHFPPTEKGGSCR